MGVKLITHYMQAYYDKTTKCGLDVIKHSFNIQQVSLNPEQVTCKNCMKGAAAAVLGTSIQRQTQPTPQQVSQGPSWPKHLLATDTDLAVCGAEPEPESILNLTLSLEKVTCNACLGTDNTTTPDLHAYNAPMDEGLTLTLTLAKHVPCGGCGNVFSHYSEDYHWNCGNCWDCCECPENPNAESRDLRKALESWELPEKYDLARAAADFYTYYYLSLNGYKPDLLEGWLAANLRTFLSYTDMVVGGEFRYCQEVDMVGVGGIEPWHVSKKLQGGRPVAWSRWKGLRDEYGTPLLAFCRDNLKRMGNQSVGGVMWANIADALLMYEEGTISPTMFVDLAFGLEHNNGKYLDKLPLWRVGQIHNVLDANLADDMGRVAGYASKEAKEEYTCFTDSKKQPQPE